MAGAPATTDLDGTVALVAGATRGAGRGIAAALGERGATVLCTGRSTRAAGPDPTYARTETIEDTADLVTALGGRGVPIAVDHHDRAQVAALADRVRTDHGRLHLLVNNTWGGELLTGSPDGWDRPVWEVDLDDGLRLLRNAVETHLITAHHLLGLVVAEPGGLLVELTDGTRAWNETHYRISAFYDLAKASVNRLAFSLGHELARHGATAVAVSPGWLRSEMMLEAFGGTEEHWRDAPDAPGGFELSESPRLVGRGIAAMVADPDRARWNQRSVTSTDLARAYGVTDTDGTVPDVWGHMADEEAGTARPIDTYRTGPTGGA